MFKLTTVIRGEWWKNFFFDLKWNSRRLRKWCLKPRRATVTDLPRVQWFMNKEQNFKGGLVEPNFCDKLLPPLSIVVLCSVCEVQTISSAVLRGQSNSLADILFCHLFQIWTMVGGARSHLHWHMTDATVLKGLPKQATTQKSCVSFCHIGW